MPAIPIIGLGISAYSAYKQSQAQKQAADMQKQMFQAQSSLANTMQGIGNNQMSMAEPALSKAMGHYMQLASGNRGAIGSELAPDINGVTEASRGAQMGISRSMAPGPNRDKAIADLYRQRAGQIGMMPFQARNAAFGNLQTMGTNYMNSAMDAYKNASSALTGASNTGTKYMEARNQQYGTYGDIIKSGVQAGQDAYDWYKRSRTPGMNGGSGPGLPDWIMS